MKILLVSVGTRGDMEPFLALGAFLTDRGHEVIYAFPEQFRDLVEETETSFFSLGKSFIELLESDTGKAAMGGGGTGVGKMLAYIKLASKQTASNKELLRRQHACAAAVQPDRIVYNGKAIYPIIWERDHPGQAIFLSAVPYVHYMRGHTHVAFSSNFGPILNKLTYGLADFGLIATVRISMKWLSIKPKIPRKQIKEILRSRRAIYTISPAIFPRPSNWDDNVQVVGFYEKPQDDTWQPEADLEEFLARHDRMLLITFGSMTNPSPAEKIQILVNILERNRIPAVINTASEGLIKPESFDDTLIHFVSSIPYDWILPKMYGAIHHGGSGTTQLALKYGCASLIIPHIIDQFVWNDIVAEKGVGPEGIRISKITEQNLEPKIIDLVSNPEYKNRAEKISRQMQNEDLSGELYRMIVG